MTVTHPELVKALVKDPLNIMTTLSQFSTDLWHGATGVAGEAGELLEMISSGVYNHANLIEELGDLEFYMEQIRQRIGLDRQETKYDVIEDFHGHHSSLLDLTVDVVVNATQILDLIKKCAIYNKPLELTQIAPVMNLMDVAMGRLRRAAGVQRSAVLTENIRKLSKRYEGLNYSDTAAQERKDKLPQAPKRNPFPGEPAA